MISSNVHHPVIRLVEFLWNSLREGDISSCSLCISLAWLNFAMLLLKTTMTFSRQPYRTRPQQLEIRTTVKGRTATRIAKCADDSRGDIDSSNDAQCHCKRLEPWLALLSFEAAFAKDVAKIA